MDNNYSIPISKDLINICGYDTNQDLQELTNLVHGILIVDYVFKCSGAMASMRGFDHSEYRIKDVI